MNARQIIDEAIEPKRFLRQRTLPRIRISFTHTTPEDMEQGDSGETGWIDEEGVSMVPDEFDREDGKTAVDLAVAFLRKEGVSEHSSSEFDPRGWYMTEWSHSSVYSEDEEQRSFHLTDFTQEELRQIYDQLRKLNRV